MSLEELFDELLPMDRQRREVSLAAQVSSGHITERDASMVRENLSAIDKAREQERMQHPAHWPIGSSHPIGAAQIGARVVRRNRRDMTVTLCYRRDDE